MRACPKLPLIRNLSSLVVSIRRASGSSHPVSSVYVRAQSGMGGGGVFGGFGDNNGGYAQACSATRRSTARTTQVPHKACKYFQGPGGCKNGARCATTTAPTLSADA